MLMKATQNIEKGRRAEKLDGLFAGYP